MQLVHTVRILYGALRRALRGCLGGLVGLAALAAAAATDPGRSALAQEATASAGAAPVSTGDLESRIGALEEEIARLEASLARREGPEPVALEGENGGARVIGFLSDRAEALSENVVAGLAAFGRLPELLQGFVEAAADPAVLGRVLAVVLKIAVVLGVAFLAERGAHALLSRPRRAIEGRENDSLLLRAPLLLARTLLDLVPIAVFAAAGYGVLPLLEPDRVTRLVAIGVVNANVVVRAILAVARMAAAPRTAALRPLPLDDETAAYAFLWARRLAYTTVYGYVAVEVALLLGLPVAAHAALLKLLGLVVAGFVVVLVLQNRSAVAEAIRGRAGEGGRTRAAWLGLRGRLADVWHVLAILYVAAIYGTWLFDVAGGFAFLLEATVLSLLVFAAARLVLVGVRRAVERGFALGRDLVARFPDLEARANRYLAVLHGILRGFVYLLAALVLLRVWGADSFAWLATEAGRAALVSALNIAAILLVAFLFWLFASALIERALTPAGGAAGEAAWASPRARTLLPLLRNALFVALAVLVAFVVLAELGMNVAPLLAGAGVVGLAIGFGAQSLVKDVIAGAFILLEDTIAVGDVVDLGGGHAGLVEKMSIRAIRLRDLAGNVHTVPFGTVDTVLNMTKEFSYYLFDVGIAYREDVDEVIRVLRGIGEGLQADPEYGPLVLEPLEVLGLDKFADSAVVIKARIKTLPIHQWRVGREFNRRMKRRFDELGIEIPFPHRTLYFGEDKEGAAAAARVRVEPAAAEVGGGGAEEEAVGKELKRRAAPDVAEVAGYRSRRRPVPGTDADTE